MRSLRYFTAIGLTAMSTLMLELILTRIFSVTMWYHFAFMAISLALFGLSAGASLPLPVAQTLPAEALESQSSAWMLAFAATLPLIFAVIIRIPFDGGISWHSFRQLTLIYILAAIPFLLGGMAISLAFRHRSAVIDRVYFSDLVGAGIGCALTLLLLNVLPAPEGIIVIAMIGAVAALLYGWRHARLRLGSGALLALLTVLLVVDGPLGVGIFQINRVKGVDETVGRERVFEEWNSFSRIVGFRITNEEIEGWGLSGDPNRPTIAEQIILLIDGDAATPIALFDGDAANARYLLNDVTNLVYHLRQDADVLVIGPGGGRDVLAALASGQANVDGVELNPLMVDAVNQFDHLSGGIYGLPNVNITIDEGRNFIARADRNWDIIQSSLVDTWAATSAGAFVLSESNLYTVEAFQDYVSHLSEDGIFTMSRWFHGDRPTETLRMTAVALTALERMGIEDAPNHIAVVIKPESLIATLLVKRTPFTAEESERLVQLTQEFGFTALQIPNRVAEPPLRDLVYNANRANFWENYPSDVSPTTDDKPYFFYTLRLDNLDDWRYEQGVSNMNNQGVFVLYSLLGIVTALALLTIILPLWWKRRQALTQTPGGALYLLYFTGLGLGFLMVEIPLVQRFSLFLGHPIYALAVILFAVLLFSGVGSYLSGRLAHAHPERTATWVIPVLLLLLTVYAYGLTPVLRSLLHLELPARIGLSVLLIAPLGLLMGMPMPLGISVLDRTRPALIPWMWGVNGATSVVASVLAMVVSLNIGLRGTLLVGMAIYAVAWLAMLGIRVAVNRSPISDRSLELASGD
ncbi:MAG: hypothetical protein R2856_22905 [Caldilineaceae bacterium]